MIFTKIKSEGIYGDNIKWTPLQFAAAIGKQKSFDFLIELGADPSIKDDTGKTAVEIAEKNMRNLTQK
jgi:ankyrin repeat protein